MVINNMIIMLTIKKTPHNTDIIINGLVMVFAPDSYRDTPTPMTALW